MTEKTATEASNDFWVAFKAEKTDIESLLEKASTISKVELPAYFNSIVQHINELEKKLTKATEFIPSYDERQYSLQLKELTTTLEAKRTALTPKPKFSFKSRNKNKTAAPQAVVMETKTAKKEEDEYIGGATIVFKDKQNEVLRLSDYEKQSSNSIDILLSNLDHCVVLLEDKNVQVSAIHIKNVNHCVVLCGSIQGSVLMYGFSHSIMILGCHQLRMHDAHHVDILLHVTSKPIIEDSNHVCFGSYPISESVNYYDQVEDFNWLKKQASPNWSLMDPVRQEILNTQLQNENELTVEDTLKLLPASAS